MAIWVKRKLALVKSRIMSSVQQLISMFEVQDDPPEIDRTYRERKPLPPEPQSEEVIRAKKKSRASIFNPKLDVTDLINRTDPSEYDRLVKSTSFLIHKKQQRDSLATEELFYKFGAGKSDYSFPSGNDILSPRTRRSSTSGTHLYQLESEIGTAMFDSLAKPEIPSELANYDSALDSPVSLDEFKSAANSSVATHSHTDDSGKHVTRDDESMSTERSTEKSTHMEDKELEGKRVDTRSTENDSDREGIMGVKNTVDAPTTKYNDRNPNGTKSTNDSTMNKQPSPSHGRESNKQTLRPSVTELTTKQPEEIQTADGVRNHRPRPEKLNKSHSIGLKQKFEASTKTNPPARTYQKPLPKPERESGIFIKNTSSMPIKPPIRNLTKDGIRAPSNRSSNSNHSFNSSTASRHGTNKPLPEIQKTLCTSPKEASGDTMTPEISQTAVLVPFLKPAPNHANDELLSFDDDRSSCSRRKSGAELSLFDNEMYKEMHTPQTPQEASYNPKEKEVHAYKGLGPPVEFNMNSGNNHLTLTFDAKSKTTNRSSLQPSIWLEEPNDEEMKKNQWFHNFNIKPKRAKGLRIVANNDIKPLKLTKVEVKRFEEETKLTPPPVPKKPTPPPKQGLFRRPSKKISTDMIGYPQLGHMSTSPGLGSQAHHRYHHHHHANSLEHQASVTLTNHSLRSHRRDSQVDTSTQTDFTRLSKTFGPEQTKLLSNFSELRLSIFSAFQSSRASLLESKQDFPDFSRFLDERFGIK